MSETINSESQLGKFPRLIISRGHLPIHDEASGWMRVGGSVIGGVFQRIPVLPLEISFDSSEQWRDSWGNHHGETKIRFDAIANIDGDDVIVCGEYYRSGHTFGFLDVIGSIQDNPAVA